MPGRRLLIASLGLAACLSVGQRHAQSEPRSGKQVVDQVCAGCHETGDNGAPRIGDADAWDRLAARGMSGLTESAIQSVRSNRAHSGSPAQWRPGAARAQWRTDEMSARGGHPRLTDLEIGQAVRYMIEASRRPPVGDKSALR